MLTRFHKTTTPQAGAAILGCSFLRCTTSSATGGGGAAATGLTANAAGPSLPSDAFGQGTVLWPPYVFADHSTFTGCSAGLGQGGAVLSFNVGLLASAFTDNDALFGGAVAVPDGGQLREMGSAFRANHVSLAGGAIASTVSGCDEWEAQLEYLPPRS